MLHYSRFKNNHPGQVNSVFDDFADLTTGTF
jgi:hypothetical protein